MDEPTSPVWVKTSALDQALLGKARRLSRRSIPFLPVDVEVDTEGSGGSFDEDDGNHRGVVNWGWARGTYIESSKETPSSGIYVLIKDEQSVHNNTDVVLPADSFSKGDIVMGNVHDGNYPDDLTSLTHLHEPAVLYCMKRRYAADKIYTATGPMLIAVNPFKECDFLFSDLTMRRYRSRGERLCANAKLGASSEEKESEDTQLPPSVYGTADNSYRCMMAMVENPSTSKSCDQCILVSGESGSGKTVTTRFVMQYLASLSRRRSSDAGVGKQRRFSSRGVPVDIELQILQSNPILESFGNARTIRNDNSSRFGKFTQMHFASTGALTGASIETYLLEKVRLTSQAAGERNYHIFYEILKGMESEELERHFLTDKSVEDFKMTSVTGVYDRRDEVDDGEKFKELIDALDNIGISQEDQENMLAVTCALLHASNLSFKSFDDDEAKIDEENSNFSPFLSLLEVGGDTINKHMCSVELQMGKEIHIKTLSKDKAEKGMEAFIKATYGALFNHIVNLINTSISDEEQMPVNSTIGVLDIFGFESFKTNSFEQLCINYCNEILQQQFNSVVFNKEKEEYGQEGIKLSFMSFPDNQCVLDLIDSGKPSVFNLLTDQCKLPRASDKAFANSLYQSFASNKSFEATNQQIGSMKFSINHYAGLVEYNAESFVGKNRDELPRGATEVLLSSSNDFVKGLATIISPSPTETVANDKNQTNSLVKRISSSRDTISGKFRRQLREMRQKIDTMNPHFIRCLKPNDELVPDYFDPVMIVDQLRSAGVVEAIRISRIGYPQRFPHSSFVDRYWVLGSKVGKFKPVTKEKVEALVSIIYSKMSESIDQGINIPCNVDSETASAGIQVGKTTVFLRQSASELLEKLRNHKLKDSTIRIQATARGYNAKKLYGHSLGAIVQIQCYIRTVLASMKTNRIRRQENAIIIQSACRRMVCRNAFILSQTIARWLQRMQRGRMGRLRYMSLDQERQVLVRAAVIIQCSVRCKNARGISKDLLHAQESKKEGTVQEQTETINDVDDVTNAAAKGTCSEKNVEELSTKSEEEKIERELVTMTSTDDAELEPKIESRPLSDEVLYSALFFLGGCGVFSFSLTYFVIYHFLLWTYELIRWTICHRGEILKRIKGAHTQMRVFRNEVWPCVRFLCWLFMTVFTKKPTGRKLLTKRPVFTSIKK